MGVWVDRSLGKDMLSALQVPPIISQILKARGVTTDEEMATLFSPKLASLEDPFAIDQMDVAVECLVTARTQGEVIGIYGDYDLDGTPAIALLKRGLELLGFQKVFYYQPRRLKEGYGFHIQGIDVLKAQGVSLIITVDVGMTDIQAIRYAKECNVKVIVTDHHLPKDELPLDAVAVVNPNKGTCPSGLTYFCGTGLAFYLVLALRKRFKELNLVEEDFNPKALLDCFVIGTLTDMVPLVKENRVLVKHGLLELEKTQRPGLNALLENLGLAGRTLSSQDVVIRFTPKLNALSRMDRDILPLDIFLEANPSKAKELAKETVKVNQKRVQLQGLAQQVAEAQIKKRKQEGYVWVWSKDFHVGVVGLVAANLTDNLGVPVFIGSVNERGSIVGSGRRPRGSSDCLLEALKHAEDLLMRFGGHSPAAGFELDLERAQDFDQRLCQFYTNYKSTVASPPPVYFDGEGSLGELTQHFMKWYEGLEPFGVGFEVPVIKFSHVSIEKLFVLRGNHLKMWLRDHSGRSEAIWFTPPKPFLGRTMEGETVSILATPQWNYFMNKKRLQLLIQDLKEVGPLEIEKLKGPLEVPLEGL